jgi:hypothetical protein
MAIFFKQPPPKAGSVWFASKQNAMTGIGACTFPKP